MGDVFTTILEVLENYETAVFEKNVERFMSSFSPDIHLYDCWDDWEIKGIAQWREVVDAWFNDLRKEGVLLKTAFTDVVVEEHGDLGLVYCAVTYAAHDKSGEKLRQMTNRFTFGLRKRNESWSIVHSHSSLPVSSETGNGIFNLK
ncbi:nuclear transport factor 2 family protein [Sporosarcina sp. Sa2YVA2]|uniref:Nuclear transport factor 2 family protein n=1 Tax=Sporosarcina quadrami TaxID=2762234 RepID=A0ABR8UET5_9BACL|nr:nuclear transport factor 2 family protein [Sporosarcina quadrami]MBD7986263.1 nuclear transport factor 2 family protein [Sporosarcina quadrami]